MPETAASELRLLIEQPNAEGLAGAPYLTLLAEAPQYLVRGDGATMTLQSELPPGPVAAVLQPFRHERSSYVAMISESPAEILLNGLPAPPVAILRVRDAISFADQARLHLTLYRRPYLGAPLAEHIGQNCVSCTTPITEKNSRLYICPACQALLHAEPDDVPEDDRFQCFQMGTSCPRCGEGVVLKEGYLYEPEV